MIRTKDTLQRPELYIPENIQLTSQFHDTGFEIVSGADFDVLVERQTEYAHGMILSEVSPLLGRLYLHGVAKGVEVGGHTTKLEWYPSPNAVNEINEQIGRTPGVDVMKFAHASNDTVPAHTYDAHLKMSEYLQSIGKRRFGHDRSEDHAVPVIYMPSVGVRRMSSDSNRSILRSSTSNAGTFDRGTTALYGALLACINADFDVSKAESYNPRFRVDMQRTGKLLGVRGMQKVADLLEETYTDIQPKINALKAEKPVHYLNFL